jgi:F0F1-type ATP synthase assembly protein I
MSDPNDEHSPWAVAMEWTSRLTTISLEMVLPAIGGYWLDRHLGWGKPVFLLLGALLGFAVSMMHLVRLARPGSPRH